MTRGLRADQKSASKFSQQGFLFNAGAMILLGVTQRALGLVSIAGLARILDPAGLGAYAFTQSTSQTTWGIARLGIDAGIHSRLAHASGTGDKVARAQVLGEGASLVLAVALIGAVGVAALADPIAAQLYGAPELTPFVLIAAVLFLGQALSHGAYVCFAGLGHFAAYSRIMSVTTILMVALTLGGACSGRSTRRGLGPRRRTSGHRNGPPRQPCTCRARRGAQPRSSLATTRNHGHLCRGTTILG